MLPQARFESGREEIEDVTVCVRWARMKGEEGTAGERKGLVEQSSEGRNNGGEGKEGIARRHGQSELQWGREKMEGREGNQC